MSVLTNAPQPYLQRGDRDNFAEVLDDFIKWMCGLGPQLDTFVNTMNTLAATMSSAIPYKFSNQTSDVDPGPGFIRLNNAAQGSATAIRLDLLGSDAVDYTALIDTFDISTNPTKGRLRISKRGDMTKFLIFDVTAKTTVAGYRNLAVTFVQGSAANPFADGDDVLLSFIPNGNQGVQGPQGVPLQYVSANGTLPVGNHYFTGNYAVTLPDVTTGQLALSVPRNAASVPSTVTTVDNWTVTTNFAVGTSSTIMPLKTGSPHGWWGTLSMTPPRISPSAVTLPGIAASSSQTYVQSSIKLSSTCVVLVVADNVNAVCSIVAVNPVTGDIGTPVSVSVIGGGQMLSQSSLHPVGTTGFVLFYQDVNNKAAAIAGTLAGLTITLGTSTVINNATSSLLADAPIQFGTSQTYLVAVRNSTTSDLVALSVSGTTITLGTAIASGSPANASGNRICALTSTTALVKCVSATSGAVTATFKVVTLSGLTLTLGAGVATVGSLQASNDLLFPFSSTALLYMARDNSGTTTHCYLVTVSGTAVSLSADVQVSQSVPLNGTAYNVPSVYTPRVNGRTTFGRAAMLVDATRIVGLTSDNYAFVASYSGTTLSMNFSSAPANPSAPAFLLDAPGTNAWVSYNGTSGNQTFQKIVVSGTSVSFGTAVAGTPSVIFNDNLNDSAVNYGGTWCTWTGLPTVTIPLAADKFLSLAGGNILAIYGNFS